MKIAVTGKTGRVGRHVADVLRRVERWSPEERQGFATRGERLAVQFDAYEVAPGKKVNGKLTLGENIADLGGLAVAPDALIGPPRVSPTRRSME